MESQRDYLRIQDFVKIIPEIALRGTEKIYNIAYGKNTNTKEIVDEIVSLTNCSVKVTENSTQYSFPEINIERIQNEFNFKPESVLKELKNIVSYYKKSL